MSDALEGKTYVPRRFVPVGRYTVDGTEYNVVVNRFEHLSVRRVSDNANMIGQAKRYIFLKIKDQVETQDTSHAD